MKTDYQPRHAEREGIVCGRMGFGDVSSWASGVSKPFGTATKPVRPEVGRVRQDFTPIRSLRNLKAFTPRPTPKVEPITLPSVTKYDPVEAQERKTAALISASARFSSLYESGIVKRKRVVKQEAPPDLLADCEPVSPEALDKLKENQVGRDAEFIAKEERGLATYERNHGSRK